MSERDLDFNTAVAILERYDPGHKSEMEEETPRRAFVKAILSSHPPPEATTGQPARPSFYHQWKNTAHGADESMKRTMVATSAASKQLQSVKDAETAAQRSPGPKTRSSAFLHAPRFGGPGEAALGVSESHPQAAAAEAKVAQDPLLLSSSVRSAGPVGIARLDSHSNRGLSQATSLAAMPRDNPWGALRRLRQVPGGRGRSGSQHDGGGSSLGWAAAQSLRRSPAVRGAAALSVTSASALSPAAALHDLSRSMPSLPRAASAAAGSGMTSASKGRTLGGGPSRSALAQQAARASGAAPGPGGDPGVGRGEIPGGSSLGRQARGDCRSAREVAFGAGREETRAGTEAWVAAAVPGAGLGKEGPGPAAVGLRSWFRGPVEAREGPGWEGGRAAGLGIGERDGGVMSAAGGAGDGPGPGAYPGMAKGAEATLGRAAGAPSFGVGPRGAGESGVVERHRHRMAIARELLVAQAPGTHTEGKFGRAPVKVRSGAAGRVARRAPFGLGCSAEEHALYGRCLDGLCGTRGRHEQVSRWYHGGEAKRGRERELQGIMRWEAMGRGELEEAVGVKKARRGEGNGVGGGGGSRQTPGNKMPEGCNRTERAQSNHSRRQKVKAQRGAGAGEGRQPGDRQPALGKGGEPHIQGVTSEGSPRGTARRRAATGGRKQAGLAGTRAVIKGVGDDDEDDEEEASSVGSEASREAAYEHEGQPAGVGSGAAAPGPGLERWQREVGQGPQPWLEGEREDPSVGATPRSRGMSPTWEGSETGGSEGQKEDDNEEQEDEDSKALAVVEQGDGGSSSVGGAAASTVGRRGSVAGSTRGPARKGKVPLQLLARHAPDAPVVSKQEALEAVRSEAESALHGGAGTGLDPGGGSLADGSDDMRRMVRRRAEHRREAEPLHGRGAALVMLRPGQKCPFSCFQVRCVYCGDRLPLESRTDSLQRHNASVDAGLAGNKGPAVARVTRPAGHARGMRGSALAARSRGKGAGAERGKARGSGSDQGTSARERTLAARRAGAANHRAEWGWSKSHDLVVKGPAPEALKARAAQRGGTWGPVAARAGRVAAGSAGERALQETWVGAGDGAGMGVTRAAGTKGGARRLEIARREAAKEGLMQRPVYVRGCGVFCSRYCVKWFALESAGPAGAAAAVDDRMRRRVRAQREKERGEKEAVRRRIRDRKAREAAIRRGKRARSRPSKETLAGSEVVSDEEEDQSEDSTMEETKAKDCGETDKPKRASQRNTRPIGAGASTRGAGTARGKSGGTPGPDSVSALRPTWVPQQALLKAARAGDLAQVHDLLLGSADPRATDPDGRDALMLACLSAGGARTQAAAEGAADAAAGAEPGEHEEEGAGATQGTREARRRGRGGGLHALGQAGARLGKPGNSKTQGKAAGRHKQEEQTGRGLPRRHAYAQVVRRLLEGSFSLLAFVGWWQGQRAAMEEGRGAEGSRLGAGIGASSSIGAVSGAGSVLQQPDDFSLRAREGLVWRAPPGRDFFRGPDVGLREPETAKTALHMAAESGSAAAVRALLEAGADPEARDAWGRRPLDFARSPRVQGLLDSAVRARDEGRRGTAMGAEVLGRMGARALGMGASHGGAMGQEEEGSSVRPPASPMGSGSGLGFGSGDGSGLLMGGAVGLGPSASVASLFSTGGVSVAMQRTREQQGSHSREQPGNPLGESQLHATHSQSGIDSPPSVPVDVSVPVGAGLTLSRVHGMGLSSTVGRGELEGSVASTAFVQGRGGGVYQQSSSSLFSSSSSAAVALVDALRTGALGAELEAAERELADAREQEEALAREQEELARMEEELVGGTRGRYDQVRGLGSRGGRRAST